MMLRTRPPASLSSACAAALLVIIAGAQVWAASALPKNLVLQKPPQSVASIAFKDPNGKTRTLGDFRGKVVVLNFWATWCVPCRKEMPTLDRLQGALGGPNFEVVPVSMDVRGIDAVRKFYAEIGVHNLAMYVDTSGRALREVGGFGLPTTLILDRDGLEVGRITGPADWDSGEMMGFLKPLIARHNGTANSMARAERSHVAEANEHASSILQRGLQWLKALFGQ
jgi:thiol-disulfide isomerase/thioredoxin